MSDEKPQYQALAEANERAAKLVASVNEDDLEQLLGQWWVLDDATALCTRFELQQRTVPEARRWHVALGGGVLYNGHSPKDLDLVFYPHDASKLSKMGLRSLYRSLRELGWTRTTTALKMARHWRAKGSTDDKHVEKWQSADGRRIDVIIPSLRVRT